MKHRRGWEGAAPESDVGCGDQHDCPRVGAVSELLLFFFFSFFFTNSRRLSSICAELGRFSQNQAVSAKLGRIGMRSKQPKQAEIGLESY